MYISLEQAVAVTVMSTALGRSSAFVGPVRSVAFKRGTVQSVSRCWMGTSATTSTRIRGLPAVEAETAEKKAERLWEMADAKKFSSAQDVADSPETVDRSLRTLQELPLVDHARRRSTSIEDEAHASALRRYQYNAMVDDDDSASDDKEYYI